MLCVITLGFGFSRVVAAQQRPRTKPFPGFLYGSPLRVPGTHGVPKARAPRPLSAPHSSPAASPTSTTTEAEPNDSPATANPAALGDTVAGIMDTTSDFDWFAIQISADTLLMLDVQASALGSLMDPVLWLVAPDGTTVLTFSDDSTSENLDSYIEYHIQTPGTYYVVIADYYGDGGSGFFYNLSFNAKAAPPPGPGDPTTLFAQNLGGPYGIAAGPGGELYVTDVDGQRLWLVSSTGAASVLASFVGNAPIKVTFDAFGNLLVASSDTSFTFGTILRVTPAGQVSTFASGFGNLGAITVSPTGDVWVLDITHLRLVQLSAFGSRKDSMDVSAIGPGRYDADLAFSPSGVLHISNGYDGIFRLVNRVPQRLLSPPVFVESIAFDADGYLYVANGYLGTVSLYDPAGQLVSDPFARSHLGGPIYLAFSRAANGSMTSRLFASNYGYNLGSPYAGGIVEMNSAGMRARGLRVGFDAPSVSLSDAANHLLGSAQLSIDAQNFLDLQGNKNGRFDIGDFRAFLRMQGQLPTSSAAAANVGGQP
jgi:sugar lactone lactonase YvrE